MTPYVRFLFLSVACLSLLSSCVKNPVTGRSQLGVMSEEKEIAMGAAYDPQIVAQMGVYEDDVLQSFIERKGDEMAAISHRPNLDFDFKIVDVPVVNAFATPGGYVYFTRGIMAHFNNEAEFAGVLGHEIGHVTARHSAIQQRNATFAQVGLIAGMIVSPAMAQMAQPASEGMQLLLLKFGRDAESQSDELGVEYSSTIGYDAHEMADFFNTLARKSEAAGGSQIPEFMSTHPNPLNRRERVNELASEWQSENTSTGLDVGRNSYLRMLEGLVYGEDPRQGFVEGNTFYHPDLAFSFPVPNGWRHQNSPQQFQMAPEAGDALMLLAVVGANSLNEGASSLIEQYSLSQAQQRQTNIHGNSAIEINAVQVSEQATAQVPAGTPQTQVRIMLIQYGGLIYQLVGAAAPADFNKYSATFNQTMQNFKELTDQAMLNKTPERLTIHTTSGNMNLSQALAQGGIPSDRLEEFAILNGMLLSDQVPSGTLLKVVGTGAVNSNPTRSGGNITPGKGRTTAPKGGTIKKG